MSARPGGPTHDPTPADVVASLFRDPATVRPATAARPRPVGKHVWASLTVERDGIAVPGTDLVFAWLAGELGRRNPGAGGRWCT